MALWCGVVWRGAWQVEQDPEFFKRLENVQTPQYLWIGWYVSRHSSPPHTSLRPALPCPALPCRAVR